MKLNKSGPRLPRIPPQSPHKVTTANTCEILVSECNPSPVNTPQTPHNPQEGDKQSIGGIKNSLRGFLSKTELRNTVQRWVLQTRLRCLLLSRDMEAGR